MEPAGDLERLPLRPGCRRVRGEVARCGDERERRVVGSAEQFVKSEPFRH